MKKRDEILEKDTWRLEDLFSSDEEWETLFQKTEKEIADYKQWEGRLAESADTLYQCLKMDDDLSRKAELLYVYAKQKADQDTNNHKYQDLASRAGSLSHYLSSESAFFVPELLAIEDEKLDQFMESSNGISQFNRVLSLIRKKKSHILSREGEEILAHSQEATEGASKIFYMFNNADVEFPAITDSEGNKIKITHGNFIPLMESSDRRVRKDAFIGLYGVYRQFQNTLAAAMDANVKQSVFYAKMRNYGSDREYLLAENEIPVKVYDNLVSAVRKNLPLLHKYVSFRKKALKLDELHMYDLYVPLVEEADKKYSFEEAKMIVKDGLAPLGEDYMSVLQEGFDNRWIDVYENEGKRSGAYSWGAYGVHPYVLLNYNGTLNHVFTLAHEMGHAIHSYYSDQHQPFAYAGYKIFVAEVASTCNEALLIRSLLNSTKDKKERCYLLNHFLESFRSTVFRQTMFAEFEAMIHRKAEAKEALTANLLCQIYHDLNTEYYGSDMIVDEEISYEWERIPHFYTPFYVYQYATGFSAAMAISAKIFNGDEKAREGYQKFLSGGCSMSPIELLRLCGIDMETPEPINEAMKVFGQLLLELGEEYESL